MPHEVSNELADEVFVCGDVTAAVLRGLSPR